MLPKGIRKIAIVPANSTLHAQTIARYSPFCEVSDRLIDCDMAVYVGYNPGMDLLAAQYKQKGIPNVCWWIGTDIMSYVAAGQFPDANIPLFYFNKPSPEGVNLLRQYGHEILRFCDMPDKPPSAKSLYDFHMCPSPSNYQELLHSGIKAHIQSVVPSAPFPFIKKPPKRKKAMYYIPVGRYEQKIDWNELKKAEGHLYRVKDCFEIMEKTPDIQYSLYGHAAEIINCPKNVTPCGVVENLRMHNFYEQHNIVLRWTMHEGIAQSVIEGKQAGLQVVTNADLPHVHKADTVDGFVKVLNSIYAVPDKVGSKYFTKTYHPKHVVEKWRNFLNEWKKTSNSSNSVALLHQGNKTSNVSNDEGLQGSSSNGNATDNHVQV